MRATHHVGDPHGPRAIEARRHETQCYPFSLSCPPLCSHWKMSFPAARHHPNSRTFHRSEGRCKCNEVDSALAIGHRCEWDWTATMPWCCRRPSLELLPQRRFMCISQAAPAAAMVLTPTLARAAPTMPECGFMYHHYISRAPFPFLHRDVSRSNRHADRQVRSNLQSSKFTLRW